MKTLSEIQAMPDAAVNAALAEAMGYEPLSSISEIKRHDKHVWFPKNLPNYTASLDALRPVFAAMTTEQWWSYSRVVIHSWKEVCRGVETYAKFLETLPPETKARCALFALAQEEGK